LDEGDEFSNHLGSDGTDEAGHSSGSNEEMMMMMSGGGCGGGRTCLTAEARLKDATINQLRSRLLHLEKTKMDNVPSDAAREISRLHSTLVILCQKHNTVFHSRAATAAAKEESHL